MSYKADITRNISNFVSVCRRPLKRKNGLRILMYHSIGGQALNDKLGIFSISPRLFENHIKLMSHCPAITNVDLEPLWIDSTKLNVSVTFDDGYLDNLRVAAPILMKYKIPFTVFITSDFVQQKKAGFLTPLDLVELASLPGVTIGAHGATHTPLTQCNGAQLVTELYGAKHYIEDTIGQPVTSIAYPHGATNRHIQNSAVAAGYQLAVCSQFGINRSKNNPLMLSRTTILKDDHEREFEQKLFGDWDWYQYRNLSHWYTKIKHRHQ